MLGQIEDSIYQTLKEFDLEKDKPQVEIDFSEKRVGRNDPCPCGSGKKYKKCCWPKYGY
jgi:uncharacterized protein YecA (UPF0149 family)